MQLWTTTCLHIKLILLTTFTYTEKPHKKENREKGRKVKSG